MPRVQEKNQLCGGGTRLAEQTLKGWRASDELFIASRQPTADASHIRRGCIRVLLCGAAGVGVDQFRGLRPALAHALKDDRRAETFSTLFQVHFCHSTSNCQHRRRKAWREKP